MTIVWLRTLAVAAALGLLTFSIMAQGQKQAEGERRSKEVRLTEKLMQNFIAAQKLIAPIAAKYEFADKVDPRVQSQVERIANSNGFASIEELGDVSFTVSVVLAGLDRQTGQFTDVPERIKNAMEGLKQDKQCLKSTRTSPSRKCKKT